MMFKGIISCHPKYLYAPRLCKEFTKLIPKAQLYCCRAYFSSLPKLQKKLLVECIKPNQAISSFSQCNFRIFNSSLCKYSTSSRQKFRNRTVQLYIIAGVVLVAGLSYAAVPLYRIYCQTTGKGGQAMVEENDKKIEQMSKIMERVVTVRFNADTISSLHWNFKPQQNYIKVVPGETALAFYTAKNPMNEPVIGIATYNVLPFEAGQYFNKIQCFCFEEQRLNPNEEVDMPVFFYLDPEFAEDPRMENVDEITLSYTFFEAKEGLQLPVPTFK